MSLKDIYPQGEGVHPIYPDETNQYLQELKPVPTLNIPKELATKPKIAIEQTLAGAQEAVRRIEISRRHLAGTASVLEVLVNQHPDAVEQLSAEQQAFIADLVSRIKQPEDSAVMPFRRRKRRSLD